MIRQAISCDICGRDKQQTNHWFVVSEHGAELRISGWHSQARMSAKAKHLCGQTCLHKLVDDFMARTLAVPAVSAADNPDAIEENIRVAAVPAIPTDISLTASRAHPLSAPSAVPISAPYNDAYDPSRQTRLPVCPPSAQVPEIPETHPSFNSHTWRAEAWKREQLREQQRDQRNPRKPANRPSIA